MAVAVGAGSGLRVLPAERRPVALMVLLNGLICLGAVSVQTAGLGLFLDRFGPGRLAGAYLVAAIATAGVSAAYLVAASRLPFPRLTVAVLATIAALTAVEWAGVRAGWGVAVYLLPAWFQVVMAPAQLVYWAVADSLFDVRQARRLFGTLTAGRSLGFLLGGLAAPLLLRVIDTAELLLVAVAGLAAAATVLGAIWRLASSSPVLAAVTPPPIAAPGRRGRTLRALAGQRYHRAIIAFVVVWWIGYYAVDKLFLDAVAAHRVDPAAIAGFLGVFYALAAVAQLLVGAFGTARITERFGLTVALVVTPVLIAVLAVTFTGVAAAGASVDQLLLLAVALKAVDHAVGFALDFAVHGLAYRPVPLAVVGKVATLAEGFGQAVGLGIAALGLLAIEAGLRVGSTALGVTVLAVALVWAVLAADLAKRYRQALAAALTRRQFGGDRIDLVGRGERDALVAAASDPAPGVALFAARTLGELAPDELPGLLPVLAGHEDPTVRRWAFDEAAARRDAGLLGSWTPAGEPDTLARAAGVRALVAAGASEAALLAWLDGDDPAARRGAFEGAFAAGEPGRRAIAEARAVRMLADGRASDRVDVLEALAAAGSVVPIAGGDASAPGLVSSGGAGSELAAAGSVAAASVAGVAGARAAGAGAARAAVLGAGAGGLGAAVVAAMADPDPAVARAACRAAPTLARSNGERVLPALVAAAAHPATSVVAVAALGAVGPAAVGAITGALASGVAAPARPALAEALAGIEDAGAREALLDLLDDADGPTRAMAADGLAAARLAGAALPGSAAARAEAALQGRVAEQGWVLELLTAIGTVGRSHDDESFDGALRLVLRRLQGELVALAVVVARDPAGAGAALQVERATDGRRPAEVLELLEPALTPATRAVVVPALERAGRPVTANPGAAQGSVTTSTTIEAAVASLVAGTGPIAADGWLRAAACHHAGLARLDACADALRTASRDADPLVADTAARALARLDVQEEPLVLSTVETVVALKRSPLFADTPDDVLASVARLVHERQLEPGAVVVREGEEGEELYVIVSGRVAVQRGERLLDELGDGAVFGEMAVLSSGARSATVTAIEPTHLLVLDQGPLDELLRQRPEIALAIIRVLVRTVRERVSDLAALA